MNKNLIGSIVLGVILVTSVAFILIGIKGKNDKPNIDVKPVVATPVVVKDIISINKSIDMAHSMANSLIEADDIWDTLAMNNENIVKLIDLLDTIENCEDKTTLLEIANKWKLCDLSNVDDDHDDIWHMIPNASVGKSTGINENKVTQAVANMK